MEISEILMKLLLIQKFNSMTMHKCVLFIYGPTYLPTLAKIHKLLGKRSFCPLPQHTWAYDNPHTIVHHIFKLIIN